MYHGDLRPTKCLIDARMTLKIAETGYRELSCHVTGSRKPKMPDELENTWIAPECFQNMRGPYNFGTGEATIFTVIGDGTPSADVYALGKIMLYLLNTEADLTNTAMEKDIFLKSLSPGKYLQM